LAQNQQQREQRPQDRNQRPNIGNAADEHIAGELEADADAISRQFQINGFTLTKAIKAAEDKVGGTAIAAMGENKGGNHKPCVKVAVLDSGNTLKCVTVGMDGEVMTAMEWSSDQFSYSSQMSHSGSRTSIVKARDVIGKNVVNARGEDLGEIEDLAIDPRASRVGYAVLSFGGILGAGDKLFAVPLANLSH
jgi:sporulation protein YlmC with PRC-barrel domain